MLPLASDSGSLPVPAAARWWALSPAKMKAASVGVTTWGQLSRCWRLASGASLGCWLAEVSAPTRPTCGKRCPRAAGTSTLCRPAQAGSPSPCRCGFEGLELSGDYRVDHRQRGWRLVCAHLVLVRDRASPEPSSGGGLTCT